MDTFIGQIFSKTKAPIENCDKKLSRRYIDVQFPPISSNFNVEEVHKMWC